MPAQERFTTDYPGVYYIIGKAVATGKPERIYYIDYRKDGKRIQEKAGRQFQNNMTPAKASRLRTNRIEGREPTNAEKRKLEKEAKKTKDDRWTLNRIWDLYCENNAENKSLKNEKTKYNNYIRSDIGEKEPRELLPLDIDRIRIGIQKAGKRTTAARVLELLRRTINYGIKRELAAPITFKIEIPRLNNQTTEDLSPDQINKLLKVLDAEKDQVTANIMRLALYTGMRRGEILNLRWDDIDFRRGFITLRDPKGGQDATIPLNDSSQTVFNSIERIQGNEYVFPGRFKGQHLTYNKKSIARIVKAAELPKGFRPLHGLRHVYASMLASSGKVDLYTLQKLMTHKSPLMTQRYAHLRDDALKKASNLAGELVKAAVAANNENGKNDEAESSNPENNDAIEGR